MCSVPDHFQYCVSVNYNHFQSWYRDTKCVSSLVMMNIWISIINQAIVELAVVCVSVVPVFNVGSHGDLIILEGKDYEHIGKVMST